MTLLIALLLMDYMHVELMWQAGAVVLWICHVTFHVMVNAR